MLAEQDTDADADASDFRLEERSMVLPSVHWLPNQSSLFRNPFSVTHNRPLFNSICDWTLGENQGEGRQTGRGEKGNQIDQTHAKKKARHEKNMLYISPPPYVTHVASQDSPPSHGGSP